MGSDPTGISRTYSVRCSMDATLPTEHNFPLSSSVGAPWSSPKMCCCVSGDHQSRQDFDMEALQGKQQQVVFPSNASRNIIKEIPGFHLIFTRKLQVYFYIVVSSWLLKYGNFKTNKWNQSNYCFLIARSHYHQMKFQTKWGKWWRHCCILHSFSFYKEVIHNFVRWSQNLPSVLFGSFCHRFPKCNMPATGIHYWIYERCQKLYNC